MARVRWNRNTSGLKAAVLRRAEEARARTERAIDALVAESRTINFNTVAARAGVTKAYLYAHADLRERISRLRKRTAADAGRTRVGRVAPAAVELSEIDRRIAELEAENNRLRTELSAAHGGRAR